MKTHIYTEDPEYEDYKSIYDECEYCHTLISFDDLKDKNIIMQHEGMTEYWGTMVSMPDSVAGFICPECGCRN